MSNSAPILEAEVAEYLKKHPDFFSNHLDLLASLDLPHDSGQAVSLVEKQMQVLRKSNRDIKSQLNKLIEVARQNEIHFENSKQLVKELLEFQIREGSLEELIDIFDLRFPKTLAANEYRLILLDYEPTQNLTKVLALSSQKLKEEVPKLFEMEKSFCGALTKNEKAFLFSEHADLIASCAVVPLKYKQVNGLLAIGNFNEGHFYRGMGTMFLDHIGDVVGLVLNDLIDKRMQQSIAV